ncbi:right-handed parallel beta-helix repeat-containing protein [Niabella beijingensis]|uniref:right-handed parallel beta-helix repeat-containing protein n=1 Tax=Niabella beijingensis TaxID=2872700 RepID=UPI001CC14171|nr:right-handed parallel beta-helix repeat-containing protein [Niabella beijingensis]MBZ4190006.1 right-handed parallel beta-helix repeat-containing protein [Niabella beijingensis]
MKIYTSVLIACIILQVNSVTTKGQAFVEKSIKEFGAKGNGKVSDHEAFKKALAFFDKRHGNGKLIIPNGTYRIGRQVYNFGAKKKNLYSPDDVVQITGFENFTIEGQGQSILIYESGLKFGSFESQTKKLEVKRNFFDRTKAAFPGYCIRIENSKNVLIQNIQLDGNLKSMNIGGGYGDVGIQLPYTGIYILNSVSVRIKNTYVHHFGQDGITISNANKVPDNIQLSESKFEYNARQGLSWIAGNGLSVYKCVFGNTGEGGLFSPPGAGIDIEPERGSVRNGKFEFCEFSNNKGCGVVADRGDSKNMTFSNCVFNVKDNWAIWVTAPDYNFLNCRIYGPVVHGYRATNDNDATKFIKCYFEDIAGKGNTVSKFMIETNYASRILIKDCEFSINYKRPFWFVSQYKIADSMNKLVNNKFYLKNPGNPNKNFMGLVLGATLKGNIVFIPKIRSADEVYVKGLFNHPQNINLGGNQIIIK